MLFDKNILPCCSYCRFGVEIGENEVACIKRGVVDALWHCRSFKYDPIKRSPESPPHFESTGHTEEDFRL